MEDWQYRGEGNCSLAVADPATRKVYRLLKKNYTKRFAHAADGETKSVAWVVHADLQQVVSYVRWMMQPLLSPSYVIIPKLITVDENFVSSVVKHIRNQRPARRLKKPGDALEEDCRSVLVLPDFCFVPNSEHLVRTDCPPATVSIEIKPKKSFISCDFDINSAKLGVCKFCMHQYLKRQSGEWPETSNYCPLDLFSGARERMKHALQSLIETPQNNLKLWKDGKDIYSAETKGDLGGILFEWFEDTSMAKTRAVSVFLDMVIEILLMSVSPDDPQPHADLTRSPNLQRCQSSSFTFTDGRRTCQWLPQGCVLERVFAAQLLDDLDIVGVYPLYLQLRRQLDMHPQLWSEWGFDGSFPQNWLLDSEAFHALEVDSLDWIVQKVKRFLVSKTLQDCSIMVAILPLTDREAEKCQSANGRGGNNLLNFNGRWHKVCVALVDLDPKPLDKIPTYYRQSCAIHASFQEDCEPLGPLQASFVHNTSSASLETSMDVSSSVSVSEDESLTSRSPANCLDTGETKSRTQGQTELL